jgi:hypothetical protein
MSIRDLILPIAIRRRPHQYRHLLTTFGNADFQITDINSGEFREAITKERRNNRLRIDLDDDFPGLYPLS